MPTRLDLARLLPRRPAALLEAIGRLSSRAGSEAFLVGGPVRDLVLGRANVDLDIAVVGDGVRFARRLATHLNAAVRVHAGFRTAGLELPVGIRIDIATARRETYERPGALPRVTPASIEEDLYRRDFAVNAVAVSLAPCAFGAVLDPFDGVGDIRSGVLRILHPASFLDDPTRILRMVRFAARFGFRPAKATRRRLDEALALGALGSISGDRLREEIYRLLREAAPVNALRKMAEWGVLSNALPGLRVGAEFGRAAGRACRRLCLIEAGARQETVLLLLLLRSASPVALEDSLNRINLSGRPRKLLEEAGRLGRLVSQLRRSRAQSEIHRALVDVPAEVRLAALAATESVASRRRLSRYLERGALVRPELGGNDLKAMGVKPGPRMRVVLDALLEGKLDGRLRDRKAETEFVVRRFRLSGGKRET